MRSSKRKQANKSVKLNRSEVKPPQGCGKQIRIYDNVLKNEMSGTAKTPNLRISPPAQLEITQLYFEGHSLCEISRRTHRARQTVTKIVRAPDIQDTIQEMRAALLAESGDWVESLSRAVRHEMDGKLAFKLARAFGAIPSPARKAEPSKVQNSLQNNIDPSHGSHR
jgi:hypothetical protein